MTYDIGGTPISFEDVRVGDVVARPLVASWIVGAVCKIDTYGASDEDSWHLARPSDTDLRLIERPKPPLPTDPGSRINNVVLGDGERFPYAIHTFAPEGSGTRYEWVGFAFFGFTQDFDSNDITSWEPA